MKQKTVFSDVTVAAAKLSNIVNIDDRRKKVSHQELNHMNGVWNDIFNRLPAHSSCVSAYKLKIIQYIITYEML